MQAFVEQIRKVGWDKVGMDHKVNDWAKKLKLKDMKSFLDSEFGIQKFYKTKKEILKAIAFLALIGQTSQNTKNFVYENLLYTDEVEDLKTYYTQYKTLSSIRKREIKKMVEEIAKDSYQKDLGEILKMCGVPFSLRTKIQLLDLILMSIFVKYPSSVFVSQELSELEDCPICTESVKKGVRMKDCSCRMVYHKECIEKWLQINNSCPACRIKIVS